VKIPSSSKTVVNNVEPNQIHHQLYVPKTTNYTAIDAYIPGFGAFQMTVGKRHDIKGFVASEHQKLDAWDDDFVGIYFTWMGAIRFFVFLLISPIEKRISTEYLLIAGIGCVTAWFVLLLITIIQEIMVVFTIGIVLIWSIGSPICQTLTISSYSRYIEREE